MSNSFSTKTEHTLIGQLTSRQSRALRTHLIVAMHQVGMDDIDLAHGDVLNVLYKHGRTTMTELARYSHRSKATISVLVDKLKRLGYVTSVVNEMDARSDFIQLTKQGQDCREKFEKISDQMDDKIRVALTADEIATLQDLMEKVCLCLEK